MNNHLTFEVYQLATDATAIYPEAGEGTKLALAYVGLGLGEVGEVQGKLKKVIRDDEGLLTPEKREAICAEIGDVLWYCARLATELGCSLESIANDNLQKLLGRKERGTISGSGDQR